MENWSLNLATKDELSTHWPFLLLAYPCTAKLAKSNDITLMERDHFVLQIDLIALQTELLMAPSPGMTVQVSQMSKPKSLLIKR